ncbi:hypothetical protein IHN63_00685 [Deinococcus sp. 6YEL10]|uniref:SPFH domain-containing protein n=1 Tax=Deinococcus sp. 6YEL10 TaxID=2745870 RepID=UPI001E4B0196|nr:SPFH domain-containing protein [Deinococcus sp. 6YEL10]MCD0159814.1 hypothetical protein [Deinococcus sp. 6YEL10]
MSARTFSTRTITALAALLMVLSFTSCGSLFGRAYIEPGYVGIKVDKTGSQRQITEADVVVGRVTFNPYTTDIIKYPVKVQRIAWTKHADGNVSGGGTQDASMDFSTGDASTLNTDIGFSMYIRRDRAAAIYTKYRMDSDALLSGVIRDKVRKALNEAGIQYNAVDIMGKRKIEFQNKAHQILQTYLDDGIVVEDFSLINRMRANPQIEAAVQASIVAEQQTKAEQAKLEQVKAVTAQQVAQARADAERTLIKARAKAESNRIEASSLNANILQARIIEKWNGQLPQVQGSGDPIIQLRK